MSEEDLNLYVWEDVLCDYTCGIVVVYARDLEHAMELLGAHDMSHNITSGLFDCTKVRRISEPEAFIVHGGA